MRLLHRENNYIFTVSIPIATFWYEHCIGENSETLRSKASKFTKLPYSALYGVVRKGWFGGPWRSVRLLHRESDNIFRFSIPIATFWHKHCSGANTAPLWSKASKFTKLQYSPYKAVYETRWFGGLWHSERLSHRESDLILRFFIPIATFWNRHCFGANTVPLWSKASKFTKLPYSALYGGVRNRVIWRTVTLCVFNALRKRLHF